ncbi:MAG: hypothetical protein ACI8RA_002881 [Chlamydiales bacterium]|jgi:hypothetical protein
MIVNVLSYATTPIEIRRVMTDSKIERKDPKTILSYFNTRPSKVERGMFFLIEALPLR